MSISHGDDAPAQGGKPWTVQLNREGIERAAAMPRALLPLQLVLEEIARSRTFAWFNYETIADRIKMPVKSARKLMQQWETKGYGLRCLEGKDNRLIGVILFQRLDPRGPVATLETLDEAREDLYSTRGLPSPKTGEPLPKNGVSLPQKQGNPLPPKRGKPLPQNGVSPSPAMGEPLPPKQGNRISTALDKHELDHHDCDEHTLNQGDESERVGAARANGDEDSDGEGRPKALERRQSDSDRLKAGKAGPPPARPVAERQAPLEQADPDAYARDLCAYIAGRHFGSAHAGVFARGWERLRAAAGSSRNILTALAMSIANEPRGKIHSPVAYVKSIAEGLRDDPENAKHEAEIYLLYLREHEMAFRKARGIDDASE